MRRFLSWLLIYAASFAALYLSSWYVAMAITAFTFCRAMGTFGTWILICAALPIAASVLFFLCVKAPLFVNVISAAVRKSRHGTRSLVAGIVQIVFYVVWIILQLLYDKIVYGQIPFGFYQAADGNAEFVGHWYIYIPIMLIYSIVLIATRRITTEQV